MRVVAGDGDLLDLTRLHAIDKLGDGNRQLFVGLAGLEESE